MRSTASFITRAALGLMLALMLVRAPLPAMAGTITIDGQMVQGGLVRGITEPGAEVRFRGRLVRVSPDGVFLVGFGRDDTGSSSSVANAARCTTALSPVGGTIGGSVWIRASARIPSGCAFGAIRLRSATA